jgi:hypothetical protein
VDRRHLAVCAGFIALAVAWTLPLSTNAASHLPGAGIGDNVVFLWNFWWMRTAVSSGASFFHTTYIFAPVGTDLTLHTHTALPAYAGATLLEALSITTALNVTTLASLALNGICTYFLAWRAVHDRLGAITAGIVFACSPFIAAHLNGHFNLVAAWTVPLFSLAYVQALRDRSWRWSLVGGLLLGATAYIDAYLLVYQIVFATVAFFAETRPWSLSLSPGSPRARAVLTLVAVLFAVDVLVIAVILLNRGFQIEWGPLRMTAHDVFNPMQALGILAVVGLLAWRPPSIRSNDLAPARHALLIAGAVGLIGGLIAAPVIWNVGKLLVNGDYVSQQYYWRSSPRGIDLVTLVLGSPFHPLWGAASRAVYTGFGIDPIESVGWLGIVPVALAVFAVQRRRADRNIRLWYAIGCVFFAWSLGTHLFIAGHNIALVMPGAIVQFVPILANARMPGRAMVVVYLAMAVLAAVGVSECRKTTARALAMLAIPVLVLADFFVAPLPIASVTCPPIYDAVRTSPKQGTLVELPLGFGDGLGSITPVDNRLMLACQTIHGRPIAGGFVARLSPRVTAAYAADPLLAAWMRLSGAATFSRFPLLDPGSAAERLRSDAIALVLVDRQSASEPLQRYVDTLRLINVADDGRHVLYAVPPE